MNLSNLLEKVTSTIKEEHLLARGDRIVVAVSGGPDSVALLHLLFLLSAEWDWALTVAHVNHGYRPEESVKEAGFVRELAERWGLPFAMTELDMPRYLKEAGGNSQDAARERRYKFLIDTARQAGASKVALAHHADDQAETVLMRVLRGTGIAGLSGIPIMRMEKNVELVRPLLRIYKSELMDHLARHGLGYCIDSSNRLAKYERNRIRLETIPALSRSNPALPRVLNRLAELAEADNDYLEQETQRATEQLVGFEDGMARFSRNAFSHLHVALQRRMIKLILNYLSPDADSWDFTGMELLRSAVLQSGRPNLQLDAPGKVLLIREYDEVRLLRQEAEEGGQVDSYCYRIDAGDGGGSLTVPETPCRLEYGTVLTSVLSEGATALTSLEACFDYGGLHFPLYIRNRQDGDRMRIEGLNGSKKVKDIFIDAKISPGMRKRMPLLTDADGTVLWIPGVRRSDTARITPDTSSVFYIRQIPIR